MSARGRTLCAPTNRANSPGCDKMRGRTLPIQYGIDTSSWYALDYLCLYLFSRRRPPIFVVVWSANHAYFSREFFFVYSAPRYKLFFTPDLAGGPLVLPVQKRDLPEMGNPAFVIGVDLLYNTVSDFFNSLFLLEKHTITQSRKSIVVKSEKPALYTALELFKQELP